MIRFEPPSPIIENDRVNVTLHCDVVDGNPRKLLKVQWMINGDVLTELPECNGMKTYKNYCMNIFSMFEGYILVSWRI